MNGRYFQDRMATGSLPLLVAVVFATAFWWLLPGLAPDGADWGSGVAGGWPSYARRLAAYVLQAGVLCLLAWLTVRHALIRVTATCHLSLYALLAACLLPHTLQAGGVVSCCLLAMLLSLFHTYQHVDPVGLVCQGFFFFGLGTLAFPPMLLLLPFLLVMQAWFHNVTWRTFFAALIGAALPHWLMLGYACAVGDMEVFYAPLRAAVRFLPVSYACLTPVHWANLGVLAALTLWSCVLYAGSSYADKIRTRIQLYYVMTVEALCLLFLFLQPQHYAALLGAMLPCSSLLAGHYFAVNRDRRSLVALIVVLVVLSALYVFNLWTQLSNFS